jgi:hypothetical protein
MRHWITTTNCGRSRSALQRGNLLWATSLLPRLRDRVWSTASSYWKRTVIASRRASGTPHRQIARSTSPKCAEIGAGT